MTGKASRTMVLSSAPISVPSITMPNTMLLCCPEKELFFRALLAFHSHFFYNSLVDNVMLLNMHSVFVSKKQVRLQFYPSQSLALRKERICYSTNKLQIQESDLQFHTHLHY